MYLIFVNHLGVNYKGSYLYEFIFSSTLEGVDGDDWDTYPASSGDVTPPNLNFIQKIGVWETQIKLEVISNSDTFCVWDAVDGVVALAYEDVTEYDAYPEDRLVFRYGDTIGDVEDTLYSRDVKITFSDIKQLNDENH